MGLRVNTNIAALTAQRNLGQVTGRLQGNYARLSSGLRIATAADDAAGLGISERMRSQIRSFRAAGRNTIATETTALVAELDRIAGSATFNGVNLLDGSSTTASIQVGINANETIDVGLQDTT